MFLEGKCRISEVIVNSGLVHFMKNDLLNNNFLVNIVHVVPIAEYIVCSCIFLLFTLEKCVRSMNIQWYKSSYCHVEAFSSY